MDAINPGLMEAVRIYLQECSAAVPYQPFLQMVYKSNLSKDAKLYFLQHIVNNKNGKSYHNNAYGLIEYTGSLNGLEVNYKTSAGERKKEAVTYGQLFLVMGDLIKANAFVGTVRQKEYEKEFQDKDMEQKTPLEQEFTQKLASIDKNLSGGNFHFDGAGLPETSLTKNGKISVKSPFNSSYSLFHPSLSLSNACGIPPQPAKCASMPCSSGVASLSSCSIFFKSFTASTFHWYLVFAPAFPFFVRLVSGSPAPSK